MLTSERSKRHSPRPRAVSIAPVAPPPSPAPPMVAAFRRPDDTICHGRCRQPLSLQGVRGLLEADFYCYVCLTHVTIPLGVLKTIRVSSAL